MSVLKAAFEKEFPDFAYELIELQMDVEDETINPDPQIDKISRLLQLYMKAVEILESLSDDRYQYFNNKIHTLMMKKHVAVSLLKSGKTSRDLSFTDIKQKQLKEKKNEFDQKMDYGKEGVGKIARDMVTSALKRKEFSQKKMTKDLKKQENNLEQRMKERKQRSEASSVHKRKSEKDSEEPNADLIDSRFQFFNEYKPPGKLARPESCSGEKAMGVFYGRVSDSNNQQSLRRAARDI